MNTTNPEETHAPNHLREQFQEWLDSYEPDRLREIDIRPTAALLDALADCGDVLPADYCDQLDIPKGSTYAEAIAVVRRLDVEQHKRASAEAVSREYVEKKVLDQVADEMDHAANLGGVLVDHRVVDAPQPERHERALVLFDATDLAPFLSDLNECHRSPPASSAGSPGVR